jgi:hypothetical protein
MSARFIRAALVTATALAPVAGAQINFQPTVSYPTQGFRPDTVVTGDFDGVNGVDFAVATGGLQGGGGPDQVEIFLNVGDGSFVAGQAVVVGNNGAAGALAAADVDRDGDLDLGVVLRSTSILQVLINVGGTFVIGPAAPLGSVETTFLAATDIDGDGDLDFVTSNRSSNNATLLRNNGTGHFTFVGVLPVGVRAQDLAVADLNGDCRTDIAVASHDSARIDLWFNTGGGSFGATTTVGVAGNAKPSGVFATDLDADGDIDLVTTADADNIGIVVVMRNVGDATFGQTTFLSGGSAPGSIIAGDFDADGDDDIAVADESVNQVGVLANLGGAGFGSPSTFGVGLHPDGIATADLDGNGSLDLLTANRDSNSVSVLLNAGAGGTNTYCLASPNSAGYGTRIDATGSLSISANNFTLLARCAPHDTSGLFFYGNAAASTPFGNGRRCVASPVYRLGPPLVVDGTGHASRHVDFTVEPATVGNAAIVPGSTKYFQFWHRDVAGGGSLSNTSEGLRATFTP